MSLPTDSHVHTEWSWDADAGSMLRTCERAVQIGLPALAFTEHLDHTRTYVDDVVLEALAAEDPNHLVVRYTRGGELVPPPFDAAGYLAAVEECRDRFPDLRILSGLEVGEPHRHATLVAELLATGTFDRVLGSLHCLPDDRGFAEPPLLYVERDPAAVMRDYLVETAVLVETDARFEVLAHIDYPARYWPPGVPPFDPADFEEEFRHALGALAATGRALELNTQLSFHDTFLGWWRDMGGEAVSFGSDAHEPDALAAGFRDAAQLAEAHGFRPGPRPHELWGRAR